VPAILVDANIEGHGTRIWQRLQSADWREFTVALDLTFLSFRDVGLADDSPDDAVWRHCQERSYYLLTSNRNEDSEDSLEATIRREGTLESVPVLTLPLPDRVYHSKAFLERVVDKLLTFVMNADVIRGSGRLYLP
jgi:hypothetical protein